MLYRSVVLACFFAALIQVASGFGGSFFGNNGGRGGKGGRFGTNGFDGEDFGKGVLTAGVFSSVWDSYNNVLEEKPILTKACTSLVGFSVGDILAQKFVDKANKMDWTRMARLASFGFLIHGTAGHFFYGWLDTQLPGTAAGTVVTKVAIDQLAMNPVFAFVFFSYLGLVSGDSPNKIVKKLKKDWFTAVKGSW
eukprot:CAMPEP_0117735494 /NCGR_PEP_ID=MMETSP0947-20121206/1341_1 /TAXON_ID=44440 /ORGANISM="Chattonella subsalsa, Strain CCMP2191" /LENGTH=193 /DNA_ID=CAMNT_0005550551 /DNA_START=72 /DNA_END=650 /DNA_ORIENTATION=-